MQGWEMAQHDLVVNYLKGQFTKNEKISHYLLILMQMEGWVKFFSAQHTAGV